MSLLSPVRMEQNRGWWLEWFWSACGVNVEHRERASEPENRARRATDTMILR